MCSPTETIPVPDYVSDILLRLEQAGFSAYAVGGCVRDSLLGLPAHDWDICTSAFPEQTMEVFNSYKVIPTGIKHGTVSLITDNGPVEITTFRNDGRYIDHRRPEDVVFTSKLEDDLSRRDFTVNSMAYSLSSGIVDIFGGRYDLENRIIRCVGDPSERFNEDALRILRMYRFAYRLGFSIDTDTRAAAKDLNILITKLSRERITEEFGHILCTPNAFNAVIAMEEDGVLQHILPSPLKIDRCIDDLPPKLCPRLSYLLSVKKEDNIKELLTRGKYSVHDVKLISQTAALIASAPPKNKPEIKKTLNQYGEEVFFSYLSVLKITDIELYNEVASSYSSIKEHNECYTLKDLKISGNDITALGISGKKVGQMLSALLEHVIVHPSDNDYNTLLNICIKESKSSM